MHGQRERNPWISLFPRTEIGEDGWPEGLRSILVLLKPNPVGPAGLIVRPKWRLRSLRSRSQLLVCLGLVSFGSVIVRPLGGFCAVLGRLGWSTGINSWRGEREGIEVEGQRSARLSPP